MTPTVSVFPSDHFCDSPPDPLQQVHVSPVVMTTVLDTALPVRSHQEKAEGGIPFPDPLDFRSKSFCFAFLGHLCGSHCLLLTLIECYKCGVTTCSVLLNSSGTKPENTTVLGTTVLDQCARYANRDHTVNPVCIYISHCSWLKGSRI